MSGIERIAKEQKRQREVKNFTLAHDMGHDHNELAWAAVCYAAPEPVIATRMTLVRQWGCNCRSWGECSCTFYARDLTNVLDPWPWDEDEDNRGKHSRIRQLEIAGALIASEIDRLSNKIKIMPEGGCRRE